MTPMLNDAHSVIANIPNGLLTFSLFGKEFCLDIRYVLTIISLRTSKSIEIQSSNNKDFLKYQNEIFSLVTIDSLLAANYKSLSMSEYLILVSVDNRRVAFYADRIVEFISLNKKSLESLKEIVFSQGRGLIDKIEYDGKIISIINLTKIF